jgi:hypothetical protein
MPLFRSGNSDKWIIERLHPTYGTAVLATAGVTWYYDGPAATVRCVTPLNEVLDMKVLMAAENNIDVATSRAAMYEYNRRRSLLKAPTA